MTDKDPIEGEPTQVDASFAAPTGDVTLQPNNRSDSEMLLSSILEDNKEVKIPSESGQEIKLTVGQAFQELTQKMTGMSWQQKKQFLSMQELNIVFFDNFHHNNNPDFSYLELQLAIELWFLESLSDQDLNEIEQEYGDRSAFNFSRAGDKTSILLRLFSGEHNDLYTLASKNRTTGYLYTESEIKSDNDINTTVLEELKNQNRLNEAFAIVPKIVDGHTTQNQERNSIARNLLSSNTSANKIVFPVYISEIQVITTNDPEFDKKVNDVWQRASFLNLRSNKTRGLGLGYYSAIWQNPELGQLPKDFIVGTKEWKDEIKSILAPTIDILANHRDQLSE